MKNSLWTKEELIEIEKELEKMTNEEKENLKKRIKALREGSTPQNDFEKEFVKRFNIKKEKDNKEKELFDENMSKAKEEASKLMDLYLPKEYRIDGYFNSNEFKEILKKVRREVIDNFDDNIIINGKKIKDYDEKTINEAIEIYEEQEVIKILKEKYKIEWIPTYHFLDNDYIKKINEIQDKYNVILPLDYVKYKRIFC